MMEFSDNKPIYLQLADQIMDQIVASSSSMAGQRLLSVRDFAANVGVNANTAVRTYNWLQQEGIIYQERGIGYFYADDAREKVLMMRRKLFFDKELHYFLDRLRALGITTEEISNIYRDFLANKV